MNQTLSKIIINWLYVCFYLYIYKYQLYILWENRNYGAILKSEYHVYIGDYVSVTYDQERVPFVVATILSSVPLFTAN